MTKALLFVSCAMAGMLAAGSAFAGTLALESADLKDGGTMTEAQVFNSFGCTGKNISPALSWSGAPKDTKYFAVTAYDPDAPTGSGWWHWVVVNLPADVTKLDTGAGSAGGTLPEGALQTMTDFGASGYGGACPPVGDKPHHYHFTVYALKDKVPVEASASGAMAGYYIQSLKLDEAKITVTYGR